MKIQIISEGSTKFDYWKKKWGLSILIDEDVLYDTFCDWRFLKTDFEKLNIDIRQIKHIVLSHEHWDHTGGNKYECRFIEITKSIPLKKDVFTSGEIEGTYNNQSIYEQSLIVK